MTLVLASGSPRRAELLAAAGFHFACDPAAIDESARAGELPEVLVERLAREKAVAVAARHPDRVVLGADTVVVHGGDVLAKPRGADEAEQMLQRLSGAHHTVVTGWAIVAGSSLRTGHARTRVAFRPLRADEVRAYVRTGEPMDKAGAYAIQGGAVSFVSSIHGPYDNVVGLPVADIVGPLAEHGITPDS